MERNPTKNSVTSESYKKKEIRKNPRIVQHYIYRPTVHLVIQYKETQLEPWEVAGGVAS